VGWQVQYGTALRSGEPGGHGDDVAAQGGAASDGVLGGRLVRVPATRSRLWVIWAQIARALLRRTGPRVGREWPVDQVGEHGLDGRVPAVGESASTVDSTVLVKNGW
jgi:hypothetical protein